MIETVFSLFIQSLIIIIIPILIFNLQNYKTLILEDRTYDIELMSKEVATKIQKAKSVTFKNYSNELNILNDNQTITYKLNNFKLIKTVNGKGNITVFNQMRNVKFFKLNQKYIIMKYEYYKGDKWFEAQCLF
ncbi:competence type IV pilus minor pilin ComGF [Staphylococcus canis]|uniref:ComGF family competence protein n=1 Tax=Staphylococcus canis TaxID=2724942 RepID=A0ABS0TD32_9STAP|nr:hypothetical protein [Staphylococcus canis]MBI5975643.1 ComGF family competence protein [Staphylococcus canis]